MKKIFITFLFCIIFILTQAQIVFSSENTDFRVVKISFYNDQSKNVDINNDGEINLLDLAELSESYGTEKNGIEYDNTRDLNNDNIINVHDVVEVAKEIE